MTQIAVEALAALSNAVETPMTTVSSSTAPVGGEFGQNNKNWLEFLKGFKSAAAYKKTLQEFLHWVQARNPIFYDLTEELIDYFTFLHDKEKPDGTPYFAPTSLRPKLSVFKMFWKMTGRGDLSNDAPSIEVNLAKWERGYNPDKAKTFSTEQLLRFMTDAPNTADIFPKKVYIPIASCFAARGIETIYLEWSDVEYIPEKKWFVIYYERKKVRGLGNQVDTHALITGELEVKTIQEYFACFNADQRVGRFFRKLLIAKATKTLVGTNMVIGKNLIAVYGKFIAKWLQLEQPERYTGHWPRRTSTTRLAEAGRTLNQIKCVTGHKSDAVVQEYIDGSELMKKDNARALQLQPLVDRPAKRPCEPSTPSEPESNVSNKKPAVDESPNINLVINLGGGTINGALSLFCK